MEDVARFCLDHRELAADLKSLRHELRAALASLDLAHGKEVPSPDPDLPTTTTAPNAPASPPPPDALARLAWRDTPGDVGVSNKTAAESDRRSLHDIASAAAKRASEALRSLEECAKVQVSEANSHSSDAAAPAAWQRLETIRYRVYTCEQQVLLALGAAGGQTSSGTHVPVPQWRLCVLITESLCKLPWREVVRACLLGGADCIQLREKSLPDRERLERARTAQTLIRETHQARSSIARVSLIINDRVDLAILAGADGVHLGQDDLCVRDARRLAGSRLLVGVSTHSLAEARQAAADGADYCGVGAMFPTTTKSRETSGVDYLRSYLAEPALGRIPHLAIGGITPQNIGALVEAGCLGVAVSSVVCAAPDPRGVCAQLLRALTRI